MTIKVNTYQLQSKSNYAATIVSQLGYKANQINGICYNLDAKVRNRKSIGNSLRELQYRVDDAQRKLYNISIFLANAAERYNTTEIDVMARAARIGIVNIVKRGSTVIGLMDVGAKTGSAQGKIGRNRFNSGINENMHKIPPSTTSNRDDIPTSFLRGIGDACINTVTDIYDAVTHPIETLEGIVF